MGAAKRAILGSRACGLRHLGIDRHDRDIAIRLNLAPVVKRERGKRRIEIFLPKLDRKPGCGVL
jgi:hypothetical protein